MSGLASRLHRDPAFRFPGGESATQTDDTVAIRFPGPRHVLCTSWLNGGYRENLQAVFNHQIPLAACEACHGGASVKGYLEGVARDLGLDPETVTGLITRAAMKNTAVVSETFRDLNVTAIVTAGIDKNGGRVGDPASYYETGDSFEPVGGTINTILIIGADLHEHTLARAMMTATEAKAAALQQLMARSIYSTGIATGSGTDMIAIVADPASPLPLTDAGKHAKLGELIGRTVMAATTAALEWETGLSQESQRDVLVRLSRYGMGEEDLYRIAVELPGCPDRGAFLEYLRAWSRDPGAVIRVAAALHVVDEAGWGLVRQQEAQREVWAILCPGEPFPGFESPIRVVCQGIAETVVKGMRGE
jgi:adenosylcobinamide hydrolase